MKQNEALCVAECVNEDERHVLALRKSASVLVCLTYPQSDKQPHHLLRYVCDEGDCPEFNKPAFRPINRNQWMWFQGNGWGQEYHYLYPSTVAENALPLWEQNIEDLLRAFGENSDPDMEVRAYREIAQMVTDNSIAVELCGYLESFSSQPVTSKLVIPARTF